MKKILLFLFLSISVNLFAAPFNGQIIKFKQPDGTFVDLKLFGTEYYMRAEGLDNYTLIRDKSTQWICYAELSEDGNKLLSTGIIYKGKKNESATWRNDLSISKHLDISEKARIAIINENKRLLAGNTQNGNKTNANSGNKTTATPINPVSGNIKGLCIVIDFSDEVGTLPMTEFENFCNDMNYTNFGNNGSLRRFYADISRGLVDYENVVYGYYRAPLTFAQYDAMPYAQGAQQILGEALNWIQSQGFDFSTLSTNPDGSIQAINMMYTGYPPNWAEGMWFHKGNYNGFSANGVHSDDYNCSPANDPLTLATVAHENGHMIGKWPDTYKYDSNNGVDGIGSFDLMCWYGDSYNPVPPNPLFRSNVGWGRVIDVTNYNGVNTDTANSGICYKFRNLNDTNEFFLLENRMMDGRSTFIEDEGLTIWHVDRSGNNQTTHHEIYLEHANNDNTNHSDACFEQSFNMEYGVSTAPASNFYNGDPSGLRVWDIGPINNVMNYKLGSGQAGPTLHLSYISLSGDNNANGFLEPAESADLNVNSFNTGQLSSASATVSCTAIGANAGYVTVNTTPVSVGVINVSQTIPATFNITIAPNTPLGTEVQLKFLLSDGANSIYFTRKITVGVVVTMNNNQQVTTCSAVFYDEGENSDYNDYSDFTKTFYPASTGQKIKANFTSFNVEDENTCGYDYLKIYNGPNTSSPLIGTFCGTNSPNVVTSSHATGALTFKFHADEGVAAPGWKALMSCDVSSGADNIGNTGAFEIYPNPSAGIFNIKMNTAESVELSVTDVLGRILIKKTIHSSEILSLDLSDQPDGMYFIKLKTGERIHTEKLLLNR